jgi:Phage integrase SAM-like domain
MYRAEAKKGSSKYGDNNSRGTAYAPGLSEREQERLNSYVSLGLTKNTWSNYRTAEKMLRECCKEKGMELVLPVTESVIMRFVLWLAEERGVSSGTISVYLSGIKNLHVMKGMGSPNLRSEQVNLVLKGMANGKVTEERRNGNKGRKPVTPDILRLIKARISESEFKFTDKRMLWTVCSMSFFGAFRSNELLCKEVGVFDPAFTLCAQVVEVKENEKGESVLRVKVKAPKENKIGKSVMVDVFEAVAELCPVRAFKKWIECGPPRERETSQCSGGRMGSPYPVQGSIVY